MSNIINCNNNNIFVNFSFVLLSKIIKDLDNNIDIICFTLVCKRFFENRDKYIVFNNNNLPKNKSFFDDNNHNYFLKSYEKQIDYSRKCKSISNLAITSQSSFSFGIIHVTKKVVASSYCITKDTKLDKIEIPSSVTNVYFDNNFNESIEYLLEPLRNSNVTFLSFGNQFAQPIRPGTIPPNIKHIRLGKEYTHDLTIGTLPCNLEVLHMDKCQFQIKPGVLPQSLKSLTLSNYHQPIDLNLLPPNLELMRISNIAYALLEDGVRLNKTLVFPSTLRKIYYFPLECIHLLPPTVTSITLYSNGELLPGDIPPNITTLDLGVTYDFQLSVGSIPPTVKKLSIGCYPFKIEHGIIPNSVESLELSLYAETIDPNVIPPSVRVFSLSNKSDTLQVGSIPFGVEILDITNLSEAVLKPNFIPTSVKKLILRGNVALELGVIPESVEYLNLKYCHSDILDGVIPNSVKRLFISLDFFCANSIHSIPTSVNIIKIREASIRDYFIRRIGYNHKKNIHYFLIIYDLFKITTFKGGFVDDTFFDYLYDTSDTKKNRFSFTYPLKYYGLDQQQ